MNVSVARSGPATAPFFCRGLAGLLLLGACGRAHPVPVEPEGCCALVRRAERTSVQVDPRQLLGAFRTHLYQSPPSRRSDMGAGRLVFLRADQVAGESGRRLASGNPFAVGYAEFGLNEATVQPLRPGALGGAVVARDSTGQVTFTRSHDPLLTYVCVGVFTCPKAR